MASASLLGFLAQLRSSVHGFHPAIVVYCSRRGSVEATEISADRAAPANAACKGGLIPVPHYSACSGPTWILSRDRCRFAISSSVSRVSLLVLVFFVCVSCVALF